MDDLISKKRLLKMMSHWKPYMDMGLVRQAVERMPTVDAVEVKDLRKQLLREGTLLYGGNVEFEKKMGGYNPSSFVAGFNYALQRMSGWVTFLDGERKEA